MNQSFFFTVLILSMTSTYASDLEPSRQMPNQVPTLNQANELKVNFAYSFDEERSTATTSNYQHNLRLKFAAQRFDNQWLKGISLETYQRHDEEGDTKEQYLNSFKLAKYKNDFNYRYAKAQWEKDNTNNYDSLSSFTLGLGKDFYLLENSSFSGELGLSYRYNEGVDTQQISENEMLATAGVFFKHIFNPMISYEQNVGYELAQDNHILRGKSALNIMLNKNYIAQASYHIKHQDDPWITHTDSKIAIGVEYKH